MNKTQLLLTIIAYLLVSVYSYGQVGLFEIVTPASSNEHIIDVKVSDAPGDYFQLRNATVSSGQFIPILATHRETDQRVSFWQLGTVNPIYDQPSLETNPIILFDARVKNSNNVYGPALHRNLFSWASHTTTHMVLNSSGNLGLGSLTPKSKIQVSGGDVYIDDVTKGIIMKSTSGFCFRIQVADNGSLTSTQINCP